MLVQLAVKIFAVSFAQCKPDFKADYSAHFFLNADFHKAADILLGVVYERKERRKPHDCRNFSFSAFGKNFCAPVRSADRRLNDPAKIFVRGRKRHLDNGF